MRTYRIKEIFKTHQGEGANAGRVAVFVRFSGCNLWSGREEDRRSAVCRFCDTEFRGTDGLNGGTYNAVSLAQKIAEAWEVQCRPRFVVLTGGEPMLQVDPFLIDTLRRFGCEIAIETNGTKPVPTSVNWITVSPKAGTELVQTIGQELKVVFPQPGLDLDELARLPFRHHFLQPMDGPDRDACTRAVLEYTATHPLWRVSIQLHKILGIP